MQPKDVYLREVLFEFYRVKNFVRVTAIDPITGIEATTVGSKKYSDTFLKRLAIKKLRYVIAKYKTNKNYF